jgi:hypothetical protein
VEAMTNNVPSMVRRFLDIEAQVGNEEDNDEDGDHGLPGELTLVFSMSAPLTFVCILDDFIDDQDCGRPEDAPQRPEGQLPDQDEERLHDLLTGILQRSRNRSAQQASSRYDGDVDSDDSDTPATITTRLPTNADYPLLRVRCVVSLNHYNLLIFD